MSSLEFWLRTGERIVIDRLKTDSAIAMQMQGYEQYLKRLRTIVVGEEPIVIKHRSKIRNQIHRISFTSCRFESPHRTSCDGKKKPMYPYDAMMTRTTYSFTVIVNVMHTTDHFAERIDAATAKTVALLETVVSYRMIGRFRSSDSSIVEPDGQFTCAEFDESVRRPSDGDRVHCMGTLREDATRRVLVVVSCVVSEDDVDALDPRFRFATDERTKLNVPLCKIPLMIGCSLCNLSTRRRMYTEGLYDRGGTFGIRGPQRVIRCVETIGTNSVTIFEGKQQAKARIVAECRSRHRQPRSTSTLRVGYVETRGTIDLVVHIPFLMKKNGNVPIDVRLVHVFRRFGLDNSDEILEMIFAHTAANMDYTVERRIVRNVLMPRAEDAAFSIEKTLHDHLMTREFLPHIGVTNARRTQREKMFFFATRMLRPLLEVITGKRPLSDRDSHIHRRIESPGPMLARVTRQQMRLAMKTFRATVKNQIAKGNVFFSLTQPTNMTTSILANFSSGSMSPFDRNKQAGCVQNVDDLTRSASVAQKSRTLAQLAKDSKKMKPRHVNLTGAHFICPSTTSEGKQVGHDKAIAVATHVSVIHDMPDLELALPAVLELEIDAATTFHTPIWVNGRLHGFICDEDVDAYVRTVRDMRRNHNLPIEIGVIAPSQIDKSVRIELEYGRLMRPLYVAERMSDVPSIVAMCERNNLPLYFTLLREGVVELVSVSEENADCVVADRVDDFFDDPDRYTHVAIDFSVSSFSLQVSRQPLMNYNQTPRVCYAAQMRKAEIGFPGTDFVHASFMRNRYVMGGAQRPIVSTFLDRDFPLYRNLPSSMQPLTVAVMAMTLNQEDALIFNNECGQRGFMRVVKYMTVRDTQNVNQTFCRPAPTTRKFPDSAYVHLDPDGLPRIGSKISVGDVVIGKTLDQKSIGARGDGGAQVRASTIDLSKIMKENKATKTGTVVDVVMTSGKGRQTVSVVLAYVRDVTIGDKVASRHGQKGTFGGIANDLTKDDSMDLPFDPLTGRSPTIIISPHAIPSRMTIGHLLEASMANLGLATGKFVDGTSFRENITIQNVCDALEACGLDPDSESVYYSSRTGKPLRNCKIFRGGTAYMRLKHFAADKSHARNDFGPRQPMTRQPSEGRGSNGGLRVGEMEKDALVAHAATAILKDRLCDNSDAYTLHVCRKCNNISDAPRGSSHGRSVYGKRSYCRVCDSSEHTIAVKTCYSSKVVLQEMMSLYIKSALFFEKKGV